MQSEEAILAVAKALVENPPEERYEQRDGVTILVREYRRSAIAAIEAALSAAEPMAQDENPMRFFADNVDNWGALEWFNRLVDACEDHDRKRTEAFRCADPDEKDMLSLSADTSKMIMSSSAFHLAREHKSEIRSALSALTALTAQVQDVATPEGWQLVPKEPTDEMAQSGKLAHSLAAGFGEDWGTQMKDVYRAMLVTAPAKQEG